MNAGWNRGAGQVRYRRLVSMSIVVLCNKLVLVYLVFKQIP
jgi:hypothetical protein